MRKGSNPCGLKALIVGLGNPGSGYLRTRHNFGRIAVEFLGHVNGVVFKNNQKMMGDFGVGYVNGVYVMLLLPNTYMNLSGRSVHKALCRCGFSSDRLLVVFDDMEVPLGKKQFRCSGSYRGHQGLKNIGACIGGDRFPRLSLGIGRPECKDNVSRYVLSSFLKEEESIVEKMCDEAISFIERWVVEVGSVVDG